MRENYYKYLRKCNKDKINHTYFTSDILLMNKQSRNKSNSLINVIRNHVKNFSFFINL